MSDAIQFDQASGGIIKVEHDVDGIPLAGITAAKYEIYDKSGVALLNKTFGAGVTFSGGKIVIELTEEDTENLSGQYTHGCVVQDMSGRKLYPVKGSIWFDGTKVRL